MDYNTHSKYFCLAGVILLGIGLLLFLNNFAKAQGSIQHLSTDINIYHVSKNGDGTDGLTWTTAFTDLQDALLIVNSGEQIWVATGVYTPGISPYSRFQLEPGVELYGGFLGNEIEQGQRDWDANPTVLSGDIYGDDITDENGVVTDTVNIVGTNKRVMVIDGTLGTPVTSTTIIDGFTITGGNAVTSSDPFDLGGGIYCNGEGIGNECSPTLNNVIFSGNSARQAGAMYNNGPANGKSNPSYNNVRFFGNSAQTGNGGAIFNQGYSNGDSSPSFSNVVFSQNHAASGGGAIFNMGGEGNSSPSFNNVTFSDNTATSSGGAMRNEGYSNGKSSPSLINVVFSGNVAEVGGAILNVGIYNGNSSPGLDNVVFYKNIATNNGGAMLSNCSDGGFCEIKLNNVTFFENVATNWGGAMLNGGRRNGTTKIELTNTILWNNTAGTGDTMYNATITAVITNSLIQGGIDGSGIYNADSSSSIIDGGGVIDADPTFVDAENGNLRLIEQSVAVDAGINSAVSVLLDLDGEQRISNGIVDMGAYEFQFPRIMTVTFTGTGTGLVNSNGIGYTDSFIEEFTRTIPVTLTAVADPGSFFTGWGGECYGIGNCLITMTESKEIIANFDIVPPGEQALSVFNIGEGVGTVTSIPVGIDCGLDCTETYSENSVITLTAMSEPGSFFTGWSGACTGTGDCIVTIEAATQVTATFALMQYDLSLSWRGTGEGHIVSDPAGINCDGACAASFSHGTLVTLTAVPATNSSFDGWGGACTDASGLVCTLTIEGETGVSATFTKIEYNIYLPTITKGN